MLFNGLTPGMVRARQRPGQPLLAVSRACRRARRQSVAVCAEGAGTGARKRARSAVSACRIHSPVCTPPMGAAMILFARWKAPAMSKVATVECSTWLGAARTLPAGRWSESRAWPGQRAMRSFGSSRRCGDVRMLLARSGILGLTDSRSHRNELGEPGRIWRRYSRTGNPCGSPIRRVDRYRPVST